LTSWIDKCGWDMSYKIMKGKNPSSSDELKSDLKAFAASLRGFFLISGTNGVGKTFCAGMAACEVSRLNSERPMTVKQTQMHDMMLKENKEYGNALYAASRFKEANFLAIDDLAANLRRPSDALVEFLYKVIDFRYDNNKATMITTNANSKEVRDFFGDALTSRMCSGVCYRIDGPDRRFSEKF